MFVVAGSEPGMSLEERAADYLKSARCILFPSEESKLAHIRTTYAVDDEGARAILNESYRLRDREYKPRAAAKKEKAEPFCGHCGQPFQSWRAAWDHEIHAHAMEQRLFGRDHGGG